MTVIKSVFIFALVLLSLPSLADYAVIAVAKGDGKILSKTSGKGKSILFEGEKYWFTKARVGRKAYSGELVQCGPKCKMRLNFSNGDHIFVAAGTAIEIPKANKKEKSSSSMKVIYGKFRSIISKNGPRKKLKVKTKSAVAGIRGTDFFTASYPQSGTHITVLRGEVEVQASGETRGAPKTIGAYETAEVPRLDEEQESAEEIQKVAVHDTNKEEVNDILASVDTSGIELREDLTSKEKLDLEATNEAAKQLVLDELKEYDPQAAEKLKDKDLKTVDEMNKFLVAEHKSDLPEGKLRWQPAEEEERLKIKAGENESEQPSDWLIFQVGYTGIFHSDSDSHSGTLVYNPRVFKLMESQLDLHALLGLSGLQTQDRSGNTSAKVIYDVGLGIRHGLTNSFSIGVQAGLSQWPDDNTPFFAGLGVTYKWLFLDFNTLQVESEQIYQLKTGLILSL